MANITASFMNFLETRLMPVAAKIGNQRHMSAIRDGIIITMPLTIIGSVFLIIANFPIRSYMAFMQSSGIASKLQFAVDGTFELMGIIACLGIAYRLAESYKVDALSSAVLAFCSFVIVTPFDIPLLDATNQILGTTKGLSFAYLNSGGLFVGIIVALISTEIYRIITQKEIIIKMPDGVPPAVSKSFAALIPGIIIITFFWVIRLVFAYFPTIGDMHNIIHVLLVGPLTKVGNTYVGVIVCTVLIHLLWTTGIHGATLISGIMDPIWITLMGQNKTAYDFAMTQNINPALPNIVTKQLFDIFQSMGGSGATLSLAILLLFFSKSKQSKEIGKLSIGPGLFNINEPILFGIPVVMNPIMFFPFILAPIVCLSTAYWSMKFGWVPKPTGVSIPWTTPPIIGGILVTNSIRGGILQFVNIILTFGIYYPFFKIVDNQNLKSEQEAATNKAT